MNFNPIITGALYPSIPRGLSADLLVTQSISGTAYSVCTSHVVAGQGVVTDVLNVPTDTISAQLEHIFETESPTAAKIGIIGSAPSAKRIFEHLKTLQGPVIYDLTVSGPSGEDVLSQQGLKAVTKYFDVPDLITIQRTDASLVAGMEIPSLDDAQVAAQRIAQQGASRVLLRCGRLPTHFFDTESDPPDFATDLYFNGEDFAVFEAPFLPNLENLHGASSGLLLPLLKELQEDGDFETALQNAKSRVSHALRTAQQGKSDRQNRLFFEALQKEPTTSEA